MAQFAYEMPVGDTRTMKATATWPRDVPELGVTKGQPYPLEQAARVWFEAKLVRGADQPAVITKATDLTGDNAITFTGSTAYWTIHEADTAAFENRAHDTRLSCELKVLVPTGEPWAVAEGVLTLTV